MDQEQEHLNFIFRRAYRRGQVRAADVMEAFGVQQRTADRRIASALDDPRNLLVRKNRSWVMVAPHALGTPPQVASEEDLLNFLRIPETRDPEGTSDPKKHDLLFFQWTGLRTSELNLTRADWLNNAPMKPGILTDIVRALQSNHSMGLEISYVGLGRGETGGSGWQRIIPLSLQVIGDQYSVYALRYAKLDHDKRRWVVSAKDKAVTRTFVLSRILDAKFDPEFRPRSYEIPYHKETPVIEEFTLNSALTEDQKEMVRHELKIVNDTVTLPESRMFQFKRFYSNLEASAHAVWPLLTTKPKK